MTSTDIKNVTFEKAMRGYRAEDVDAFLSEVARTVEELTAELQEEQIKTQQFQNEIEIVRKDVMEAADARVSDAENKMYILAQKVEEYRGQEDTLKTALINAQRMGETVVHEAKQKAESMVREATGQAELLHQQAEQDIAREQLTLEKLQAEVTRFKATILNLYKQHIESLSELDTPLEHIQGVLEGQESYVYEEESVEMPEYQNYGGNYNVAEPEVPDYKQEAAEEAGIETAPPEPERAPTVNLFEGVQIDQ